MTILLRRCITFPLVGNIHSLSRLLAFSSSTSIFLNHEKEAIQASSVNKKEIASGNDSNGLHLSPLFSHGIAHLEDWKIDLVDAEAWRVSSGLAKVWRGTDKANEGKSLVTEAVDGFEVSSAPPTMDDPDFDDIEDMRIRGNLFYKLDRTSKEFEEYNFDFHRKKSSKYDNDPKGSKTKKGSNINLASEVEKSSKNKVERKKIKKSENPSYNMASEVGVMPKSVRNEELNSLVHGMESSCVGKRDRIPTFNQSTAPYHEPFCLDIYVSKGSVRACIIHRATSKVVVVAHSISKDMKFDLTSTKNATACAAVGEVLAQRALADDIHNAVYTPRRGERLEGKLQILLQSIIDNGVNVKVKIKQRKIKKASRSPIS